MKYVVLWMAVARATVGLILASVLPAGCVSATRIGPASGAMPRQTSAGQGDSPAALVPPGGSGQWLDSAAEQLGMLNAAFQGFTGVSIQQAIPLGLVFLVVCMLLLNAFQSYLSHRREVLRIKAAGRQRDRR